MSNTQITEDYVSFETAKLLKEKGFEGPASAWIYIDGSTKIPHLEHRQRVSDIELFCPTQALVLKWFRIVHNIHIDAYWHDGWHVNINSLKNSPPLHFLQTLQAIEKTFPTIEEAIENAIQYTLKELI